jgi:hypothetical protein
MHVGDDKFRANTSVPKAKCARSPVPPLEDGTMVATDAGVTESNLKQKSAKLRMCGFLRDVTEHFDACQTMDDKGKKLTCAYCGKLSYQFCSLCGVAVHKFPQDNGESSCFFRYHDTGCFGLARSDFRITNKKQKDWKYPTMAEIKANEAQMKQLSLQVSSSQDSEETESDNGV